MKKNDLSEEFLHFIWKFRMYREPLILSNGQRLEVIRPGDHNRDAGPDFTHARLRIGEMEWAGNVEIHTRTSLWYSHGHHDDPAYRTVVLHVVHTNDLEPGKAPGPGLPQLELREYLHENTVNRYHHLLRNRQFIPCGSLIESVDPIHITGWIDALVTERLERKLAGHLDALRGGKGSYRDVLYRLLFRAFGYRVNALPFEMLQESIDHRILERLCGNGRQLEALLLGQAGFLERAPVDGYTETLRKEYAHLKEKHGLSPLEFHVWKFLRLRPSSFPTVRLVQLAALLPGLTSLEEAFDRFRPVEELKPHFPVKLPGYWSSHYLPGKAAASGVKGLGEDTVDRLLINFAVPLLMLKAALSGNDRYQVYAFTVLRSLPPEKNNVVSGFSDLGVAVGSAFESQAVLELKGQYCRFRRCLDCRIGYAILRDKA